MPQKKTGKTPAARWTPPNSQADDAPMTAEDYLALAEEATSVKKRLEYIKKALELEPDNLSAQLMEAIENDDLLRMISLSEQMIAQEEASLRDQGYFKKECIGDFWLIWETRDYMRMRIKHLGMLTMIHRLRAAVAEAKDLLRLCTGDNVGARYILMGLYVALEEKDELEKLLGQYDEAGPETLFARSMTAFRFGDMEEALAQLKKIRVPSLRTFIHALLRDELEETYPEEFESVTYDGIYQYNTIGHLIEIWEQWAFLLPDSSAYLEWAYEALKKPRVRS